MSLEAQDYTDAERFSRITHEGTARSQAMGSAFGALGADLSCISINPAGLATYRSGDIGLTLGVDILKSQNELMWGATTEESKACVPFNQLGIVLASSNDDDAVSHAFNIGYTRLASYNRNLKLTAPYSYNSMLDYFCTERGTNRFEGDLAYEAYMIEDDFVEDGETHEFIHNVWEYPMWNSEKGEYELPLFMREDPETGDPLIDMTRYVEESGYTGRLDFTYGLNIKNIVYWGFSMGIQTMNFRRNVRHYEDYYGVPEFETSPYGFCYRQSLKQKGAGFNFSTGVIIKPIDMLRVGVAIHSPSYMNIDDDYEASFETFDGLEDVDYAVTSDEFHYRFHTPSRFVASAASVIGSFAIVSFDYELQNYSKGLFREEDGASSREMDALNDNVKAALDRAHHFRFGAEFKPLSQLALRAGFKIQTSPYKEGIQFSDFLDRSISGGIGYRANKFYLDVTYVNRMQRSDEWMLPDTNQYDYDGNWVSSDYMYAPNEDVPSTMTLKSHRVVFSVGYRF